LTALLLVLVKFGVCTDESGGAEPAELAEVQGYVVRLAERQFVGDEFHQDQVSALSSRSV
jgi:hypothetical protein